MIQKIVTLKFNEAKKYLEVFETLDITKEVVDDLIEAYKNKEGPFVYAIIRKEDIIVCVIVCSYLNTRPGPYTIFNAACRRTMVITTCIWVIQSTTTIVVPKIPLRPRTIARYPHGGYSHQFVKYVM